jgi:hypothetical protein
MHFAERIETTNVQINIVSRLLLLSVGFDTCTPWHRLKGPGQV